VRKIAQGGQAKIFLAKYLKTEEDVVVKRYTSCQVKAGELQRQMERVMKACEKRYESGLCRVIGVSVDEKGRVSTVMELMAGDLRNFIDRSDSLLSYGVKLRLMSAIARGIRELHGCGFIHKDLKASNILVSFAPLKLRLENEIVTCPGNTKFRDRTLIDGRIGDYESSDVIMGTGFFRARDVLRALRDGTKVEYSAVDVYAFGMVELLTGNLHFHGTYPGNTKFRDRTLIDVRIGDYESSDVVMGTGFFRAPEVLRALRDGTKVEYSAAVDVYGFGMVCYELLTGNLPFHGHSLSDYDLVLSGERPDVSNEVPWMRNLLHRCWHEDPHQRPGWDEILQILM
jgi:serine/threonine protein kinase